MKICFIIICTNSDLWFSECKKYIENLIVPENMEIGVIGIRGASGMAAGYADGSRQSGADYKIYLHQDTFIINRHFLEDVDRIFRLDDRIGVIGMLGGNDVQNQTVCIGKWQYGKLVKCNGYREILLEYREVDEEYQTVDCLDGMILVTRYDVPWREDIFTGWHFYDRSICLEYRRRGYICVVPNQKTSWCIHACGAIDLIGWNEGLAVFLKEYTDFFAKDEVLSHTKLVNEQERLQLKQIADNIEILINNRKMNEATAFLREIEKTNVLPDKKIIFLNNLIEIWKTGQCNLFFKDTEKVCGMEQKYFKASFILRRENYDFLLERAEVSFVAELSPQEKDIILKHEVTRSFAQSEKTAGNGEFNIKNYIVRSARDKCLNGERANREFDIFIYAGAALSGEEISGYRDDIGDNISHQNRQYNELTVLYWAWKNQNADFIGLEHYRRSFDLNGGQIKELLAQGIDAIIPRPALFANSLETHYKANHCIDAWNTMMDILKKNCPAIYSAARTIFAGNVFYPYNMGIFSKRFLNLYCEWLFPILDQVVAHHKEKWDKYQNRYPGFLAERLFTLFVLFHQEEFKFYEADVLLYRTQPVIGDFSEEKMIAYIVGEIKKQNVSGAQINVSEFGYPKIKESRVLEKLYGLLELSKVECLVRGDVFTVRNCVSLEDLLQIAGMGEETL